MTNNDITITDADYKNIFIDIAEKLFDRKLIDNEERIKLVNIINRDKSILTKEG